MGAQAAAAQPGRAEGEPEPVADRFDDGAHRHAVDGAVDVVPGLGPHVVSGWNGTGIRTRPRPASAIVAVNR
jgi:hypothetical protein